jgi:hypothetical protein
MRRRFRARDVPVPRMEEPWTGHLGFDVLTHTGSSVGRVDLLVDVDHVRVRFSDRDLAVLDRDEVRDWLRCPIGPIVTDDIVLAAQGRQLTMAMGMAPPQPLPSDVVVQLKAVI